MSEAVTNGVRVKVQTQYVPERSSPMDEYFFFAYRVSITNEGNQSVKLVSRHWVITDGTGEREEVSGPGVVGKQPTLSSGESFTYTSACPLSTPLGSMQGTYQMILDSGDTFDAEIAPFNLRSAQSIH